MRCHSSPNSKKCGQCLLTMDNPSLYRDLPAYHLMKIVTAAFVNDDGDNWQLVLNKSTVGCNGSIYPSYSRMLETNSLLSNKVSIKTIFNNWYALNKSLDPSMNSFCIQIDSMIHIMDLIDDYQVLSHLIQSLYAKTSKHAN